MLAEDRPWQVSAGVPLIVGADMAGLYRGGCITLLRDIPAHAIYFTSYELCHELFEPGSRLTGTHSPAALFVSGEPSNS